MPRFNSEEYEEKDRHLEIETDSQEGFENDNEDDNESDEECEDHITIRAKWCIDGCATLEECARVLEMFANNLRQMESDGWQLLQPIQDDYGFVYKQ